MRIPNDFTDNDKTYLLNLKQQGEYMLTLKTEYLKMLRKYSDTNLTRKQFTHAFHSALDYVLPRPEES